MFTLFACAVPSLTINSQTKSRNPKIKPTDLELSLQYLQEMESELKKSNNQLKCIKQQISSCMPNSRERLDLQEEAKELKSYIDATSSLRDLYLGALRNLAPQIEYRKGSGAPANSRP